MKIYLIYRNADMTEGRGPMILVRLMVDRDEAIKYALEQPGVMGTNTQRLCNEQTVIGMRNTYGPVSVPATRLVCGDWEVVETEPE